MVSRTARAHPQPYRGRRLSHMEPYDPPKWKKEWAVQCWAHIQSTRLIGGGTHFAHFKCKVDVTEDLLVMIPRPIVIQAANRVGLMGVALALEQHHVEMIQNFFVGHPCRMRYYLESQTLGDHTTFRYGGTILEI